MQQRHLQRIPTIVFALLFSSLILQIAWSMYAARPTVLTVNLPAPPSESSLRLLSLGDPISTAKLLMLWLQSFEQQGGRFSVYREMNYAHLCQWLTRILALDPRAEYPLLAASHLYTAVSDPKKQVLMLEFIYTQFWHDPKRRWQWLAHAAILAKHRLHDLPLALKYARAVAQYANPNMPTWAQTMPVFILEEIGELEAARVMLGGLLDKGYVTDLEEIRFFNERLKQLEAATP